MRVQDGLLSDQREGPHPYGQSEGHPLGHGQQSGQPPKVPRGHHWACTGGGRRRSDIIKRPRGKGDWPQCGGHWATGLGLRVLEPSQWGIPCKPHCCYLQPCVRSTLQCELRLLRGPHPPRTINMVPPRAAGTFRWHTRVRVLLCFIEPIVGGMGPGANCRPIV